MAQSAQRRELASGGVGLRQVNRPPVVGFHSIPHTAELAQTLATGKGFILGLQVSGV